MNIYRVSSVKCTSESLSGKLFVPNDVEYAQIGEYPWGGGYRPDARAHVVHDGEKLIVTLCANEPTIAASETRFGGPVCVDSCLEFFVNPCPRAGDDYINFEVNPLGTMHIGVGASRAPRRVLDKMPDGFDLSISRHAGSWWAVRYCVPFAFLQEMTGAPVEDVLLANFYKCDESIHPHFGTWNPVIADQPDFHRPECFGRLELA